MNIKPSWVSVMQKEKSYWARWYIGVILFLLLQVALYYFITINYK